jgi:hypothetical protein
VCAQALSLWRFGANGNAQPAYGATPRIGATATCRPRRGTCRLCVTSVEPGRLLALELSDPGHTVHICFLIEPWCAGALASCVSACDGPFPVAAQSAIAPLCRAFSQVLGEVKGRLERQPQEVGRIQPDRADAG